MIEEMRRCFNELNHDNQQYILNLARYMLQIEQQQEMDRDIKNCCKRNLNIGERER